MNKRPYAFRLTVAIIVMAIFGLSMYPLTPRDFYETLNSLATNSNDPEIAKVIAVAKEKQSADNSIYSSQAVLDAADSLGVDMTSLVKGIDLQDNRDVISLVRKKSGSSIRLGMDLNGGVEFLLELIPEKQETTGADGKKEVFDAADRFDHFRDIAIETLRTRMESQKIFESEISPAGGRFISLRVPVVTKEEKLKLLELIKMSAKLRFCLVHEKSDEFIQDYLADPSGFISPIGYSIMETTDIQKDKKAVKRYYLVKNSPEMDGKGIAEAWPTTDEFGQRKILLRFNNEGRRKFGEVTSKNIGRLLGIVLDEKLYCAPVINDAITTGSAEISGRFSSEEIQNISNALTSGSLPLKIRIDGMFDTDPTLGADNVRQGVWAGIISMLLVGLFMIFYYRLPGIIGVIGLLCNFVVLLGAMAAFDSTLTLPGIGGIILAIGMSVDANILIYERIREELNSGRSITTAIDNGYSRAFTVIVDSNLTTFFVGLILMYFGTGAVKGFAVTLCLGIASCLFTALFLSRLLFDLVDRVRTIKKLSMMQLFEHPNFQVMKYRIVVLWVAVILVTLSLVAGLVRGTSSFSIDFTGGQQITFDYQDAIPQKDIESALVAAGYNNTRIAYKSSSSGAEKKLEIVVPSSGHQSSGDAVSDSHAISKLLTSKFPAAKFSGSQENSVGGLVGMQFTKMALLATFIAFIGIMFYVALRFEFNYGFAAVFGLIHDVILSVGIYLVCGRQISLPVVASVLTIIGYSINNSIVIFDRVRENEKLGVDSSFWNVIDLSVNQTLSRSVLTSGTTLLVLLIMFFFGGVSINDFVFMMGIGVVVGFFSSMYICTSLIGVWHGDKNVQKSLIK
ncbi:MAG: protein translocase subunit SecD [Lentisphaerae bacterium]|nr:protein translocase subunit SecD [Lentisphaerota bacterium]